jgi:hypothetical protein
MVELLLAAGADTEASGPVSHPINLFNFVKYIIAATSNIDDMIFFYLFSTSSQPFFIISPSNVVI